MGLGHSKGSVLFSTYILLASSVISRISKRRWSIRLSRDFLEIICLYLSCKIWRTVCMSYLTCTSSAYWTCYLPLEKNLLDTWMSEWIQRSGWNVSEKSKKTKTEEKDFWIGGFADHYWPSRSHFRLEKRTSFRLEKRTEPRMRGSRGIC